jgi:hypothetical protein
MRYVVFQPALALLLTAACGGGTSHSPDATVRCAELDCLLVVEALLTGCAAGGTCTGESTTAPAGSRICWTNGVKFLGTSETVSGTITSTVVAKQFDRVCYTRTFVYSTSPSGPTTMLSNIVQDSVGGTVATITFDGSGVPSVTCPGSPTTLVDPTCGISTLALSGTAAYTDAASEFRSPTCEPGLCAF